MKNNKGFAPILIILAVLVVGGGAVYFVSQNDVTKDQEIELSESEVVNPGEEEAIDSVVEDLQKIVVLADHEEDAEDTQPNPTSDSVSVPAGTTSVDIYLTGHSPHYAQACFEKARITGPITIEIPPTPGVLRATIEALFAFDPSSNGLDPQVTNITLDAGLEIDDISITNGVANIYLIDSDQVFSQECMSEWLKGMLSETAEQFPAVNSTNVYINGVLI